MEEKEIDRLIRYHQTGLDEYRQHMRESSQYLEKRTIDALEEFKLLSRGRRRDR